MDGRVSTGTEAGETRAAAEDNESNKGAGT